MSFKEELISRLKAYPDLYNEVRSEIIMPRFDQLPKNNHLSYVDEVDSDNTLEEVEDKELVTAVINNLKYYIEYEREIGESDI
ncbi:hypothetical protein JCM16358_00340 [Halanaerocella petrolearia]